MPTYQFHLHNSNGVTGDVDVRDLVDDNAAVGEARKAAGDLLTEELVTRAAEPIAVVSVERDGQLIVTIVARASIKGPD